MNDTAKRNADLRHILSERRREMQHDAQRRLRDGRTDQPNEARDMRGSSLSERGSHSLFSEMVRS